MASDNPIKRDEMFLKLFLKNSPDEVSEDELEYFRQHPDEIDEVTAPINIHKVFLGIGLSLGFALVALSKLLLYSGILSRFHEAIQGFMVDIVFEVGVALIGAAITAYVLGILMNQQQDIVAAWRVEIRRRLNE